MFVMMDLETREFKEYFNPVILNGFGRHRDTEGCLSFKESGDDQYYVRRKLEIEVTYRDIDNTVFIKKFDGQYARCFQHELNHLDGITMDMVGKKK